MLGSEFVSLYGDKGVYSWEAAAVELVRQGAGFVDWPWQTLSLSDGSHTVELQVKTDYFAVGTEADHLYLPLRPITAQTIANLHGWLLPTPLLVYRIWQQSETKLDPNGNNIWVLGERTNLGDNMRQYCLVDGAVKKQLAVSGRKGAVSGHKKDVVVSNLIRPEKVVIFGWYRPSPPHPDVFDDGKSLTAPNRQPVQPHSNLHAVGYVDYSHGIRFLHPACKVDGQEKLLDSVYQDPVLSKIVSHDGPIRNPRYAAPNTPAPYRPSSSPSFPLPSPDLADVGLKMIIEESYAKR